MEDVFTFTVDTKLCTLNQYIDAERSNKFKAAKIKSGCTFLCSNAAMPLRKKVNPERRYHFLFEWFVKNKKEDPDNISFAQKFIFDGLVKAGVLANDGHKNVASISHQFIIDKKEGVRVTLVDEDIPGFWRVQLNHKIEQLIENLDEKDGEGHIWYPRFLEIIKKL